MPDAAPSPVRYKQNGDVLSDVSAITNYFVERSKKDKIKLSNLAMQKLVYFAYGWVLGLTQKKLFYDRIEAWQYGPVIPSLYHQLKRYGHKPVTDKILEFNYERNEFFSWNLSEDGTLHKLMDIVWRRYKSLSPDKLMALTHEPGTPWFETINKSGLSAEITDDSIYEYFLELVNNFLEGVNK